MLSQKFVELHFMSGPQPSALGWNATWAAPRLVYVRPSVLFRSHELKTQDTGGQLLRPAVRGNDLVPIALGLDVLFRPHRPDQS